MRPFGTRRTCNSSNSEAGKLATVTVSNTAPNGGLPPYVIGNDLQQPQASNTMYLSLYSPLDLREASVNRAPFEVEPQQEFGGKVYSSLVTVPAGETRSIRFELHGFLTSGAAYHLDLLSQPMINADGVRIQVHTDDPAARITGAIGASIGSKS